MLQGQCLCGEVIFKIHQKICVSYQCHCSLCRKQSGSNANYASLIKRDHFEWITGQKCITTFKKDTGYTSCFCKACGSPVPNQVAQTDYMWIPLGLLQDEITPLKHLHFCINSKANWDTNSIPTQSYEHLPDWTEIKDFF